jgi:hypothetical protein
MANQRNRTFSREMHRLWRTVAPSTIPSTRLVSTNPIAIFDFNRLSDVRRGF